jgi:hypothetical protein
MWATEADLDSPRPAQSAVRSPGMSDVAVAGLGKLAWDEHSGGVDWHLELDRSVLLPGQLVTGRLSLRAEHEIEARGLLIALTAVEHWRHRESSTDGQGHTTTRVVTSRADVMHEPVQLRGALALSPGETVSMDVELPVPPDGPATLAAEDAGLDWTVEAKLDVPAGLDSRIERGVVVAQPTALLRAGAVHVGEFALYESADVAADGITASIELRPVPLVCGAPFSGRVTLQVPQGAKVRGVRAEVRVLVEATVSQGERETITAWAAALSSAGESGTEELAGTRIFEVSGSLPGTPLPSIELPHGRASATFHVILDRPFAPDTHLTRDVAIATTAEI